MPEVDTSPFKGLLRPLEPVGAPSLFFSPIMAQYVISTLLLYLMDAMKVSDMVQLVNEAFQCLNFYNLDLQKTYIQVFYLLGLWRNFWSCGASWRSYYQTGCLLRVRGCHRVA